MLRLSIQARMMLAATASLALAGAATLIIVQRNYEQGSRLAAEEALRAAEVLYQDLERSEVERLSATLEALGTRPDLQQAFRARDRETLLALSAPVFAGLKDGHGITHWYFHEPEPSRRCFLRVHQPGNGGDVVDRVTLRQAIETQRIGSGKELGKTAFALRVVRPFVAGGERLGYLELGEEIDDFLEKLKEQTGDDLAMFVRKEFLDEAAWARAHAGARNGWDDHREVVVVDATGDAAVVDAAAVAAAQQPEGGLLGEHTRGDATLSRGVVPVRDAAGRVVGGLVVVHDVTARKLAARASQLQALVFLAIAALLAVLASAAVGRGVRRELGTLDAEVLRLAEAVEEGHLGARGRPDILQREFQPVVERMNLVMDAFAGPIRATSKTLAEIARGDVPPRITETYRGDFEEIKDHLNRAIDAINALVADATTLSRAGVEGRLSTRADVSGHHGDFRKVIEGVNQTLDAVTRPLEAAARCVAEISTGRVPAPITAEYRGDFDVLKRNLNQCIGSINALVADAERLASAAAEGQLTARADAGRHAGDFRRIVEGVNRTLDAVVGPVQEVARHVDDLARGVIPPPVTATYRGDLAPLETNLTGCVAAIRRLVTDVNVLAEAAVAGALGTRADVSAHAGEYRRIVQGVNATLDALVAPIDDATAALEALAARDLRARVTGAFQGEHARMKDAVNATAEALHGAVAQVADAANQVSGAAAQIASSSQAVAAGASQQASSLQETTSRLQAVSSVTERFSGDAQAANGLAQAARTAATQGVAAVEQLQGAMGKIRASAERTSEIVRDINDVAFQTNLLALNAAVEAARAGDAGRGFAVVAEEVRSLALRAKEAAHRTEELIRESVRHAGDGEARSGETASRLAEIVGGIGKVSAIVSEIAASAREQAAGLEAVNRAVDEMDRVTQQNAASAEQSSSAATELSSQSEGLAAMVGGFRLEEGRHAAGRRSAPRLGERGEGRAAGG